tara:strand:+ start:7341 stop:7517 length:177 start_codon:yes stop_codon:yes gene_type:complete
MKPDQIIEVVAAERDGKQIYRRRHHTKVWFKAYLKNKGCWDFCIYDYSFEEQKHADKN